MLDSTLVMLYNTLFIYVYDCMPPSRFTSLLVDPSMHACIRIQSYQCEFPSRVYMSKRFRILLNRPTAPCRWGKQGRHRRGDRHGQQGDGGGFNRPCRGTSSYLSCSDLPGSFSLRQHGLMDYLVELKRARPLAASDTVSVVLFVWEPALTGRCFAVSDGVYLYKNGVNPYHDGNFHHVCQSIRILMIQ